MPGFDVGLLLTGRYHDWLVKGLVTTIQLSVIAFVLALALGLLVAALRSVPFKPTQWLTAAYVEYHRNTPALVQLFFWYFAMPEALPQPVKEWIYRQNAEFVFAVIGLGLCLSAYIAEDVRSGMRAIPKQQQEAARAIGFSFAQSLAYVILPQAVRIALPSLVNRALLTVKNSSLAMTVGVGELIYQARQVESISFRAYEAFSFITVCYLAMTLSLMALGRWCEHRQARVA